jgi:hypothetical protein
VIVLKQIHGKVVEKNCNSVPKATKVSPKIILFPQKFDKCCSDFLFKKEHFEKVFLFFLKPESRNFKKPQIS